MDASISTASVHVERLSGKPLETVVGQVLTTFHRPHDAERSVSNSFCLQLSNGFRSKKGITLSSRSFRRRTTSTIRVVIRASMILTKRSAADASSGPGQEPGPVLTS